MITRTQTQFTKKKVASVFGATATIVLFLSGIYILLKVVIPSFSVVLPEELRRFGITRDDIRIAGTGSMYPTFPKGKGDTDVARANEIVAWSKMRRYPTGFRLNGKDYFKYLIQRGDIVSFSNVKTKELTQKQYGEELGYVKRVIAVAGDRIQIREGFVVLNGERLKESYTARARSTFGGSFLPDCNEVVIPPNKLFVLGDNRTGSSDSRHELGLVYVSDVDHVMPYADQKEYESLWRDASGDENLVTQPTLDPDTYIRLLNEKRKDAHLPELAPNGKLAISARKRGEVMLKFSDLSFEATKSGYIMANALADVGYSNITWGEAPSLGYYTAQELIENSFQFPETKKFLLDASFNDIGVAAVLGNFNGCPTQVVVQHFAGYIPPNYKQETIDNWKKALVNLQAVRPSWVKLREYPEFYDAHKKDVDRMIELIDYRVSHMQAVIARMEKNLWLTKDEQAYADRDSTLYEEQDRLSKSLNNR